MKLRYGIGNALMIGLMLSSTPSILTGFRNSNMKTWYEVLGLVIGLSLIYYFTFKCKYKLIKNVFETKKVGA